MGALSPMHWAIIVILVLLLFGARRLPDMARGLGESLRILKSETKELREDGTSSQQGAQGSQALSNDAGQATHEGGGTPAAPGRAADAGTSNPTPGSSGQKAS